jgi:hypothetical protein
MKGELTLELLAAGAALALVLWWAREVVAALIARHNSQEQHLDCNCGEECKIEQGTQE